MDALPRLSPARSADTQLPDAECGTAAEAAKDAPMKTIEPFLEQHPFLRGLSPEHVRILAATAHGVELRPGQLLFREGDPADAFYLIQEGAIALETHEPGHPAVHVQTLGGGEVIGWSWLFPPFSWHFSARAIEPTRAFVCSGARLLVTCEENHDFGYEMMKRVSQIVIRRLQATRKHLLDVQRVLQPAASA
jgi:CRP-like cAMP-binding protein